MAELRFVDAASVPPSLTNGGKTIRLSKLSRHRDGRFLFIPLDHSVSIGPIAPNSGFSELVRAVVEGGADGVILHKGRLRFLDPELFGRCALIVHLSASTVHARDADAKVLVASVEAAVAIGADAVSVHVNIGSESEAAQLVDLGRVADAARDWGIPLLAMMYPRGTRIADPHGVPTVAHVANVASDLGADLVKTPATTDLEGLSEVVACCPIPLVVAGGECDGSPLPEFAREVMSSGCRGLAVGRRVFHDPNPRQLVRDLTAIVHGGTLEVTNAAPERALTGTAKGLW